MRFRIEVRSRGESWWEEYDKDTTDPKAWAQETIRAFNATLRPGQVLRRLVSVEVLDDGSGFGPSEHTWEKTNLVTLVERGRMFDRMLCRRCGITGKRFGLEAIAIDPAWKAKVYRHCGMAMEHLRKKKERHA